MGKNEVSERFGNLTKKTMTMFKTAYTSCQTNLLKSAMYAYELKEEDEVQFVDFATNELNISKGTLSKMLSAGKLMIEKPDYIELPKSYSTVYEITKVSEDIESFNEFVETEKETALKDLSNRQARNYVDEYIRRNTEESEETEETPTTETEEATDNETESIFQNLHNLAVSIKENIAIEDLENAMKEINIVISILDNQI